MKKVLQNAAIAVFGCSTLATAIAAENAASLSDALTNNETTLGFRYRLESVDQDNSVEDALASTLRTRLTYQSGAFLNTKLLVEYDTVTIVGDRNHNDAVDGLSDHSKVVDPEGSELNQAALVTTLGDNITTTVGRQRINLGNQRFVGGVGWRQNEQTYDAASVKANAVSTDFYYTYLHNVNGITGGNDINDSHIIYVENAGIENHKISAYAVLLDSREDSTLDPTATKTLGARFEGSAGIVGYTVELAKQSEYKDRDGSFSAAYKHAELSVKAGPVKAFAGTERLEADNYNITVDGLEVEKTAAFQTPLGTKHKFQGWADLFLSTPDTGVKDNYLGATAKVGPVTLIGVYHTFDATESSDTGDYGSEIDLSAGMKIGQVNALLKYADFSADDVNTNIVDTRKIWLMLATQF